MTTIEIILLAYVALDIIATIIILAIVLRNGWRMVEFATNFRYFLRESRRNFARRIAVIYAPDWDNDYDY